MVKRIEMGKEDEDQRKKEIMKIINIMVKRCAVRNHR